LRWRARGATLPGMTEGDAWEKILQLARRIDDAVASRKGVDAEEALQLARAVVAFQQRITGGAVLTPVPGPSGPLVTGSGTVAPEEPEAPASGGPRDAPPGES
jgi:hypothetical protein